MATQSQHYALSETLKSVQLFQFGTNCVDGSMSEQQMVNKD